MSSEQRVGVGCAAIIIRDGKFLMMKRAGKHGAGTWSVPGGWQEIGEIVLVSGTFERGLTWQTVADGTMQLRCTGTDQNGKVTRLFLVAE